MKCTRCKKEMTDDDVVIGITSGHRLKRCFACHQYWHKYYKKNRQACIDRAVAVQNKDRKKTNEYKRRLHRRKPENILLQSARYRAKKGNIPFSITKHDVVIPDKCPALGIPLAVNDGYSGPGSMSLDRIVPELGYVPGNVNVISHKANTIKNCATIEELELILAWLKSQQKNPSPTETETQTS
jgi:hypothetical protein